MSKYGKIIYYLIFAYGSDAMYPTKTQMFIPRPARGATLLLIDSRREPMMIALSGSATIGGAYPASDRDIQLQSEIVSKRHGEFYYDNSADAYYYIDNNSLNGTFVNGVKLQPYNERGSRALRLNDGDVLRIDRSDLRHPHPQAVLMIFSRSFEPDEEWRVVNLSNRFKVTIGRDSSCAIRVSDPMASRVHAEIYLTEKGVMIYDNKSTNGVLVNSHRISGSAYLQLNDVIRVANTTIIFRGGYVLFNNPGEKSGCLSVNIHDQTFGKHTIIRDVRFEADTKDFILVLGGSGAGKTTLINAVLGVVKANGSVILDGQSLYDNFRSLKSQVGLVPQFVNLRKNNKVYATLMDTADIRLPHFTKQEKIERIDAILKKLGVSELKNRLIGRLSGGQQKKISVAVQLIGYQKVFILDEPDSGLDPASREQQMEILRSIADDGKIVMVVSHASEEGFNDDEQRYLFSKVLVLAKSVRDNCGELAFFGSTEDALQFFGVQSLKEIIIEINPPNEGGNGKADYYIDKFRGR